MSLPDDNPKTVFGMKKPRVLSCIPKVAISWLGQVMGNGADKYGAFNWRQKNITASIYEDAMARHMFAWAEGEDTDPDSGLPHLAHVMACAAILLDAADKNVLNDDRPRGVLVGKFKFHEPGVAVPVDPMANVNAVRAALFSE